MNRSPMPSRRVQFARTVSLPRCKPLTSKPRQGKPTRAKRGAWTGDTRAAVQARSGGRCEIGAIGCLGTATNLHHRLPLRMGGSRNPALRTAANALHVCGHGNTSGCHRFLDEASEIAEVAGWKIHAGADPASVPVRYRCKSWVWLLEDGRMVGERGAA